MKRIGFLVTFLMFTFLGYSVLEDINIVLKGVYSKVNIFKPDNKGNKFGDFCCIDISLFS